MTKKKPFYAQNKGVGVKKGPSAIRKANRANAFREKWLTKQKAQAEQQRKMRKCPVCCVESFEKKFGDHCNTDLHKELTEVKQHWLWEARFHKTLDEQIEKKGSDMPFLGLKHIRQYEPNEKDEHTYECTLCQAVFRPRTIFYHVLSPQHRINYLSRFHKSMGIDKKFQVKSRELYMHLVTCTAKAALIDGRQQVKIMDHVYVPKPEAETVAAGGKKKQGKEKAKAENSETKGGPTGIGMNVIKQALAGLQQKGSIDRSGPPPPATDAKSPHKQEELMELLSTFLEARSKMTGGSMSQEGAAPNQAGSNAPNQDAAGSGMAGASTTPIVQPRRPIATIKFTKGEKEPNKTETGKSEDIKPETVRKAVPKECIPDCFWCNEELYNFLGYITVESQEDVVNVLKVTEKLSNALVRHKQRADDIRKRIEEEKKKLEEEKKAFLSEPGVNKALQKLERARSRSHSRSRSPPCATAGKRKARSRSPPARSRSPPVRSRTPPRRLSDSKIKPAPPRPGIRPLIEDERKGPQGLAAASTGPQQGLSGPQSNPSRASDPRAAFGQTLNRPQGPQSADANPSQQRMQGSQFNKPGPPSLPRPGIGFNTGPSTANPNPTQQRMTGSQFDQSRPSDPRPAFVQGLNRPQGSFMGSSTANSNPSQQRMAGSQFSQSGPSDPRSAFGQTASRPQDPPSANASQQRMQGSQFNNPGPQSLQRSGLGYSGPSAGNTNPSQQRMQGSQFGQSGPNDQRPAFGQTSNKPQGYPAGPSTANTNPSQQRMVGSQRPGFGQDSNRPQGLYTGSNTNPSQQRMAGSQFNQSRPSDPRQALASQGSESNFKQRQSRFDSVDNVQGPGMRQPIGGPRPTINQPMNEQRPAMHQSRPGLGEQRQTSDQSRTQMNEGRQSWNEQRQPLGRSWLAEAELPESQSRPKGQSLNDSVRNFNDGEPPVKVSRPSWQGQRAEMEDSRASVNKSGPAGNKPGQDWQEQRVPSGDQYSNLNKPRSLFSDLRQPVSNQPRSSFNEQRPNEPSNLSNQPRPSSNQQRPPVNQSRASYGMSDAYTDSDAYYKENERFPSSQYGNSGSTAGGRTSYGTGAVKSEESDAYYKENDGYGSQYGNAGSTGGARQSYGAGGESDAYYKENERFAGSQYGNGGSTSGARPSYGSGAGGPEASNAYYNKNEKFTGSQYGNTGSAGGARSSYGPGAAGRPGESDAYYNENAKFASSQYGNSGSAGGARQSYGSGAGGPGGSEAYYGGNERVASSQYGNRVAAGGAKSSYGSGAGGLEGSKDNYGYSSGYNAQYSSQYSSTEAQSGGQLPASMGSSYGASQGNWSSAMPARSGGPATGAQPPYSANQGTASYNESWK